MYWRPNPLIHLPPSWPISSCQNQTAKLKSGAKLPGRTQMDNQGFVFIDLSESLRTSLQTWVLANAQELPPEEPEPVCALQINRSEPGWVLRGN